MVGVRYTGGSRYSLRDGPTFTPDDRVHDVSERWAESLTRRARFEYADEADGESGESEPDADGTDENASESDSGAVVDETAAGSDGGEDTGTCAATTADGSSCENSAGPDGYCHIPSHGPEG